MATQAAKLAAESSVPASAPEIYTIDKSHSEAVFQVRHLVTKVRGRFTDFEGVIRVDRERPGLSSVVFSIDAASVDTDVADRDTHLKSPDFFDVAQYPELRFVSKNVKPGFRGDHVDIVGDLTIKGITREVTLRVEPHGQAKDPWGNTRAAFTAKTTIDRKDFGLTWNQALETGGVLVGDAVEIEAEIEAVKQAAAQVA
jgi:polyisoprenoid-binding protein YceI